MALKQFPVITRFLSVSLALLITLESVACPWGDDEETLRLAVFKSVTPAMEKFSPFFYSEHYLNEYEIKDIQDRKRNCSEWNERLGGTVNEDDIYEIQYRTKPENFQAAYVEGTLKQTFTGNSFIKALLKPRNKPLLEYFAFAKEMEYEGNPQDSRWESWDDTEPTSYWERPQDTTGMDLKKLLPIEKRLSECKDSFLQQRYAFMLIRYGNSENVKKLYERYFADEHVKSVAKGWALLFYAYMTEDKAEQNYWLSKCFDLCNEKVIAVAQYYNRDVQQQTLKLAKNDHERSVITTLYAMRNPGPVFEQIKEVNRLDPGSGYVNLLISREVNKFEDWLFAVQMEGNSPDVYTDMWDEQDTYTEIRKKNYRKDMAYLHRFREYLINVYGKTPTGGNHDYLASAIAHLSFMADFTTDGYKYASAISVNAPEAVLAQKYIELALIALKQKDITKDATKQELYVALNALDKLSANDEKYLKSLYTLLRLMAAAYNKKGDMATASLLFNSGQAYKGSSDWYEYPSKDRYGYSHVAYLDQYATLKDVNNLISLIDKKDKSPFENFICRGNIADRACYLNFKGTLAYREGKLEESYEAFAQVPDSAAYKMLPYGYEPGADSINPFYPRVLNYAINTEDLGHGFTKKGFVKEMLRLKAKTDADSYLKLGHAYYNTGYLGSAWFMCAYYQGNEYWQVDYGSLAKDKLKYGNGNYANLTTASNYYLKAYKAAKNNEQRALAALMLHVCERSFDYTSDFSWLDKKIYKSNNWVQQFYGEYSKTKVFNRYNCPELELYLK
ncbi:hypothetical protein ACLI1A_16070 [Flavobacterium sp. RHBU_3]|uniref:hypothetical protein n=1 Tax=Flavobacterium sp. RHBU_3 TaxID=3391184 RepID=UPI0039846446